MEEKKFQCADTVMRQTEDYDNIKITVVITTYNRREKLKRALNSLECQTDKDFKCIVVDDGSNDRTNEMVSGFESTASFPIEYYYQENKGVGYARYNGISHVDTEYVLGLDSDDELVDDAIEAYNACIKLGCTISDDICGVIALCKNSIDGSIIGDAFPPDINDVRKKKYLQIISRGERTSIYKTSLELNEYKKMIELLQKYNVDFLTEGCVHYMTNTAYRWYCLNKVQRIYHVENDGESIIRSPLTYEKCKQSLISYKYLISHYFNYDELPEETRIKWILYLIRFGIDIGEKISDLYKFTRKYCGVRYWIIAFPFGIANYILGKKPESRETDNE